MHISHNVPKRQSSRLQKATSKPVLVPIDKHRRTHSTTLFMVIVFRITQSKERFIKVSSPFKQTNPSPQKPRL